MIIKWMLVGVFFTVAVASSLFLYQEVYPPFQKVDEALVRVPLPPYPDQGQTELAATSVDSEVRTEAFIPDVPTTTDVLVETEDTIKELVTVEETETVQANTAPATENGRDLPGVSAIERTIVDPLLECTSGDTWTRVDCFGDYLTNTVNTEGIPVAFVNLKKFYNSGNGFVVSHCHQLTHIIGRAATAVYPTIAEAYNYGDSFCWSGYYHGIMEAIIAQVGLKSVPGRLNDICVALRDEGGYSFDYFNCVHGLGHGLMYVNAHNLFKSLEMCNILTGRWEQSSCYGGVFMENVIANEVDHVSDYLKDDDLLYPCNAVDENYKEQCYLMHTSHMLKVSDYDFAKIYKECENADEGYVNTCFQSLGRDASGFSSSNKETTIERCLLGPDENAVSNCVIGAVKDFVSYFHSDVQAREFCEALPEQYTSNCLSVMENYYRVF